MVTLKNMDSATHDSWRCPTKHVCPESVFSKFAPGFRRRREVVLLVLREVAFELLWSRTPPEFVAVVWLSSSSGGGGPRPQEGGF